MFFQIPPGYDMSYPRRRRAACGVHVVPNMRFVVIGLAAVIGVGIGTVSAVAVAHRPVQKANDFEIASTNVDLAQASMSRDDVAAARAHLETAKTRTAMCDADAACRSRVDHFNLHARLDQVERRVALWAKK